MNRGQLESILESIEIPASAYETAAARYEDMGQWLGRYGSECEHFDPHILPQGSFRLGTAIKPLSNGDAYDVDLVCILRQGLTKTNTSQYLLKQRVGNEVKEFRTARNILSPVEEKHRCWRLNYADRMSFHMDILPAIPQDGGSIQILNSSLVKSSMLEALAQRVSIHEIAITDDRHRSYGVQSHDWKVSNPEGYALWFADRMRPRLQRFDEGITAMNKAQVDDLPLYTRKTPLQRAIQLLKRHRDYMFRNNPDLKPISMIITTLAARAYQGEVKIEDALSSILSRMGSFLQPSMPRVQNPVNPLEDFAEKWYANPNLERNFHAWLAGAQADFGVIVSPIGEEVLLMKARNSMGVDLSTVIKGDSRTVSPAVPSAIHIIKPSEAPKPWCRS